MNRSVWIVYGCIIFASFGLALGFVLGGQEWYAPIVTIMGFTWIVAMQRDWALVKTAGVVIFAVATVFAAWKGFAPGLMLLVMIADLSAWDLISMLARFNRVEKEAVDREIERRHLIRLAAVVGIALLLSSAGLVFKINLNIGIEILLSLLFVFALSQLLLHLRRTSG